MIFGPQMSVGCLRISSLLAFIVVCGQLFKMMPPDELVAEGFAWTFMLMAWLGLNGLGLLIGMVLARLWNSPPHPLWSISWAIAVAAGLALSLADNAAVSSSRLLEVAVGMIIFSVPLVGGWSWSFAFGFNANNAAHSGD